MVSGLLVWELTRIIGLGRHIHEVGLRGPISQPCPEVYKIYVSHILPENAPGCMVCLLKWKSQHSVTIDAQQLRC